jgi:hypothetical protein
MQAGAKAVSRLDGNPDLNRSHPHYAMHWPKLKVWNADASSTRTKGDRSSGD